MTIPRVVHYCWFGGSPLPPYALACLESWRRELPGYEIIRWDESSWDARAFAFADHALHERRFAFVSDVCRLDVLSRHGGIYLDTDVLVKKPLDPFLEHSAFLGMMYSDSVGTAVIGSTATHPLMSTLLAEYDSTQMSESPNNDLVTAVLLREYPEFVLSNRGQVLSDGATIFPRTMFERYSRRRGHGYTQHLVANSWHREPAKAESTQLKSALDPAVVEWLGNARTIPRAAHFGSFLQHALRLRRPHTPAPKFERGHDVA